MENVKDFQKELMSIYEGKPPVSKARMSLITKNALKSVKYYKHIVLSVEKFVHKAPPEYKLGSLYVIDAIVRNSKHQFGDKDVFGPRFAKNLQQTFKSIYKCKHEDRPKVVKVLNLWQKNETFSTDVIQPLLDLANPKTKDKKINETQEFAVEALNVVDDLLSKCGKDPKSMGINPQHFQQLKVIGEYLKQQLKSNKENENDGSHVASAIDAQVVSQLKDLAAQLFTKSNESNKSNEGSNAPSMITNKTATKSENAHVSTDVLGFNRNLLDFDYGDEDEDDDLSIIKDINNNNNNLHSSNMTGTVSNLDENTANIAKAAQNILTNPDFMKHLAQHVNSSSTTGNNNNNNNSSGLFISNNQQQVEPDTTSSTHMFDHAVDSRIGGTVSQQGGHGHFIPGFSPPPPIPGTYHTDTTSSHHNVLNAGAYDSQGVPPLPPLPPSHGPMAFNERPLSLLVTAQGQNAPYAAFNRQSSSLPFNQYNDIPPLPPSSNINPFPRRPGMDRYDPFESNEVIDIGTPPSTKDIDYRTNVMTDTNKRDGRNDKRGNESRNRSSTNNRGEERRRDRSWNRDKERGRRDKRDDSRDHRRSDHRSKDSARKRFDENEMPPIKSNCISVLSKTLWIGRVPKQATEDDLRAAFKEYDIEPESMNMVPPRGCAYVVFATRVDANRILYKMKDRHNLFGKTLQMDWSPPKSLKDLPNFSTHWDIKHGVFYFPYNEIQLNIHVKQMIDGAIIDWNSVPDSLKGLLQHSIEQIQGISSIPPPPPNMQAINSLVVNREDTKHQAQDQHGKNTSLNENNNERDHHAGSNVQFMMANNNPGISLIRLNSGGGGMGAGNPPNINNVMMASLPSGNPGALVNNGTGGCSSLISIQLPGNVQLSGGMPMNLPLPPPHAGFANFNTMNNGVPQNAFMIRQHQPPTFLPSPNLIMLRGVSPGIGPPTILQQSSNPQQQQQQQQQIFSLNHRPNFINMAAPATMPTRQHFNLIRANNAFGPGLGEAMIRNLVQQQQQQNVLSSHGPPQGAPGLPNPTMIRQAFMSQPRMMGNQSRPNFFPTMHVNVDDSRQALQPNPNETRMHDIMENVDGGGEHNVHKSMDLDYEKFGKGNNNQYGKRKGGSSRWEDSSNVDSKKRFVEKKNWANDESNSSGQRVNERENSKWQRENRSGKSYGVNKWNDNEVNLSDTSTKISEPPTLVVNEREIILDETCERNESSGVAATFMPTNLFLKNLLVGNNDTHKEEPVMEESSSYKDHSEHERRSYKEKFETTSSVKSGDHEFPIIKVKEKEIVLDEIEERDANSAVAPTFVSTNLFLKNLLGDNNEDKPNSPTDSDKA